MDYDKQSIAGLSGAPKTMFLFGFISGVGASAILGLILVLVLMLNGGLPVAAAKNAAPSPAPVAVAGADEPLPPSAPVPDVKDTDHIRGSANAKVTLIEYSDFECPFCLRHEATVNQLLTTYKNDVRLIYRHYPLSFHPEAQKAAEAAECAGAQNKFWEMHDKIFDANEAGAMSVQKWKDAAKELGLNTNTFNNCLDKGEMAARVAQDLQEGTAAGVGGTPATFVNGQMVEGAVPLATIEQIVKSLGATN